MEKKVLLQLMKDDVKTLDGIVSGFSTALPPGAREADIALSRARSIVKELEVYLSICVEGGAGRGEEFAESRENERVNNEHVGSVATFAVTDGDVDKIAGAVEGESKKQDDKALYENNIESFAKKDTSEAMNLDGRVVNDMFGNDSTDDEFAMKPLKSLREGIDVNDRFLFCRELFGNSSSKYDRALNTLDNFAKLDEAASYLESNFSWEKSDTAQKFITLVQRRFSR